MEKMKNTLLTLAMLGAVLTPGMVVNAEVEGTDPTTPPTTDVGQTVTAPALETLKVNGVAVDLSKCTTDDSGDKLCTATAPNTVKKVTIEATADANSKLLDSSQIGEQDFTAISSVGYTLTVQDKQDETKTTSYRLTVERQSASATFEHITVTADGTVIAPKEGTTPTYDEETDTYTFTYVLPYEKGQAHIEAVADEGFTVEEYKEDVDVYPGGSISILVTATGEYADSTMYMLVFQREENPMIAEIEAALVEKYGESVELDYLNDGENASFSYYETLSDGSVIMRDVYVVLTEDSTVTDIMTKLETAIAEKPEEVFVAPVDNKITQEVLSNIKANGSTAYILGNDDETVIWTVDGKKVQAGDKGFDVRVAIGDEVNAETAKKINALLGKNDHGLIIDFAHDGALPKGTQVSIYVGDQDLADQKYNLYYFNEKTGLLELVIKDVKTEAYEGKVEYAIFSLEHCSSYILLPAKNNAKTGMLDVALYSAIAAVSLVGFVLVAKKRD